MIIQVSLTHILFLSLLSGILSGAIELKESRFKWFPGLVFGFLFGSSSLQSTNLIISYSVLSASVYFLAFIISARIHNSMSSDLFELLYIKPKTILIGGLLSGTFGALTLALLVKVFTDVSINILDEFITTMVGAFTGIIFLWIWSGRDRRKTDFSKFIQLSLSYISWQVPVGLALAFSINGKITVASSGSFAGRFDAFLMGPTVQLVGLLASLYGLISIFLQRKSNE